MNNHYNAQIIVHLQMYKLKLIIQNIVEMLNHALVLYQVMIFVRILIVLKIIILN